MSDPILDAKFTEGEIQLGIKHLKQGQTAGDDQILSEFISYGEQQFKYVIVDIFNELYESGHLPDQWATGVIVPIYKSGDKSNPGNYRGITLTSTIHVNYLHVFK